MGSMPFVSVPNADMKFVYFCSKWARLTLARLLLAHSSYNTSCCESYRREAQKHFKELAALDPPRLEYYQHEQSLLLLQEVMIMFS
jgi:hypothetical protein